MKCIKIALILLTTILITFSLKGQVIITVAGNNTQGSSGDGGPALSAQLDGPWYIAADAKGNFYIGDYEMYRVRKVNSSGIISTFAGSGVSGYSGDGGPATSAKFRSPIGMAVDKMGNLYIADAGNHVIRKVDTLGIITTYAGTGIQGYSGDGGPATSANLNQPMDIEFDKAGNLYIASYYSYCIRKISTSGIISTIAGNGMKGFSGNGGPATLALISEAAYIAVDTSDNVYFSESDTGVVRKINSAGIISTFAGILGTSGYTGNGGPATNAKFQRPEGLTTDKAGNVYIADMGNSVIRKVNTAGIISKYAGNNTYGYSGDGGPATLAALQIPRGVAIDALDNLFIADYDNHVIRKVGVCLPRIPEICMVQVDSLSENNIIYWDKTLYPNTDTFYVYRDTANYSYALIGKVPFNSLSMFTDTVRSLYAANGDPNASSWRYKIAYADTCGGTRRMSPMSPWHQTLFMINSGGNFIWTDYQIEGQGIPVSGLQSYSFERDNNNTGNYVTIQSLSASSTLYNDVQYSTYASTANWRVETKWNTVCTPTMRFGNNEILSSAVKSRSNVRNNRMIGINELSLSGEIKIYPNPATHELTIELSKNCTNCEMQITSALGHLMKIYSVPDIRNKVDISGLTDGVYFVKIISNKNSYYQKLIIQH